MTRPIQPTLTKLKEFLEIKGGIKKVGKNYNHQTGNGHMISQCCATLHTDYIAAIPIPSPNFSYYDHTYYNFLRFGPSDNNESHYKDTHPHRVTLTIKDPDMNLKLDWPIL